MYKAFKIKKMRVAVNRFPITAKKSKVSTVYATGFHRWYTFEDTNYSLVIGLNRIIVSFDRANCGEMPKQKGYHENI